MKWTSKYIGSLSIWKLGNITFNFTIFSAAFNPIALHLIHYYGAVTISVMAGQLRLTNITLGLISKVFCTLRGYDPRPFPLMVGARSITLSKHELL